MPVKLSGSNNVVPSGLNSILIVNSIVHCGQQSIEQYCSEQHCLMLLTTVNKLCVYTLVLRCWRCAAEFLQEKTQLR